MKQFIVSSLSHSTHQGAQRMSTVGPSRPPFALTFLNSSGQAWRKGRPLHRGAPDAQMRPARCARQEGVHQTDRRGCAAAGGSPQPPSCASLAHQTKGLCDSVNSIRLFQSSPAWMRKRVRSLHMFTFTGSRFKLSILQPSCPALTGVCPLDQCEVRLPRQTGYWRQVAVPRQRNGPLKRMRSEGRFSHEESVPRR